MIQIDPITSWHWRLNCNGPCWQPDWRVYLNLIPDTLYMNISMCWNHHEIKSGIIGRWTPASRRELITATGIPCDRINRACGGRPRNEIPIHCVEKVFVSYVHAVLLDYCVNEMCIFNKYVCLPGSCQMWISNSASVYLGPFDRKIFCCHWENCLYFVYAPRCVSFFYAPNCINAPQKHLK